MNEEGPASSKNQRSVLWSLVIASDHTGADEEAVAAIGAPPVTVAGLPLQVR